MNVNRAGGASAFFFFYIQVVMLKIKKKVWDH